MEKKVKASVNVEIMLEFTIDTIDMEPEDTEQDLAHEITRLHVSRLLFDPKEHKEVRDYDVRNVTIEIE